MSFFQSPRRRCAVSSTRKSAASKFLGREGESLCSQIRGLHGIADWQWYYLIRMIAILEGKAIYAVHLPII